MEKNQALLGSTEWAETHATELQQHAVAYFNSDGNGRGYFHAEGSHSLENFVNGVTKDIVDPETKMSVWKRERLVAISRADAEARTELRSRTDLRIGALGSGSDYTVFIDHLGIASVNLGYGGEDESDGQYHSIYDDFYWYTHFQDTDFVYGRALAQTAGTMVMRMADADVIPYQFTNLAETVHGYVADLKKLASTAREKAKERIPKLARTSTRRSMTQRSSSFRPRRSRFHPISTSHHSNKPPTISRGPRTSTRKLLPLLETICRLQSMNN